MNDNIKNRFVLCICIPTYNRVDKLRNIVQNLLNCNDSRFLIAIQDNCSTDGTESYIKEIKSDKILYRKNQSNKGPSYNYLMSLCSNESKYSLLVTDKDHVRVEFLSKFIDELEDHKPNYGIVELNVDPKETSKFVLLEAGKNAIKKTAYLCRHPTGYFYRKGLITQDVVDNYLKTFGYEFPFPFEIINAHIGVLNDSTLIHRPLLSQETFEETAIVKSFSYSGNNLFFYPHNRIKQFEVFLNDLRSLKMDKKVEKDISLTLYARFLNNATLGYMNCMLDKRVLFHYCLEREKVPLRESYKNMRIIHAIYSEKCPNCSKYGTWFYDAIIVIRVALLSLYSYVNGR